MLKTSYESHGYDGVRGGVKWWFEAWGSGNKSEWKIRGQVGRAPTPEELARADYIVIGIRHGRAVTYKTHTGGLDFRKQK